MNEKDTVKTEAELAAAYISALIAEISAYKIAVLNARKEDATRHYTYPSDDGRILAANRARLDAGKSFRERVQERELNAV